MGVVNLGKNKSLLFSGLFILVLKVGKEIKIGKEKPRRLPRVFF